jgi:GNAT superfamily N-acetyltransferase
VKEDQEQIALHCVHTAPFMTVVLPSPASTALMTSNLNSSYNIRLFDAQKDLKALQAICKNVYADRDYLPSAALSMASDPLCRFLAVVCENDQAIAVANARTVRPNMAWLEAVRTSREHQGKGLARQLSLSLIHQARENGCDMCSCTVASNTAMHKVFANVGMQQLALIHQISFTELSKLPGWAHDDDRPAQSLLKALALEQFIGGSAMEQRWIRVNTKVELEKVLRRVKDNGGIGYLPGLYELLSEQDIESSIHQGLIFRSKRGDAVFSLTKNDKIQSLRSPWVFSLAATTSSALEGALRYACSDDFLSLLGRYSAFTLSVDGAVPIVGNTLFEALPWVDDHCLLFGTAKDGNI